MKGRITQKNFQKQLRNMAEIQRKETVFHFSMFRGIFKGLLKANKEKSVRKKHRAFNLSKSQIEKNRSNAYQYIDFEKKAED